jgi:exonuclease SbcC
MTCLALALGTSEYISNKAGGISLENIFVDEGFGSLDAESLDRAIETLLELACNGKMIGIISHVEELKLRINQTIEVNKTKSGSTLKVNC